MLDHTAVNVSDQEAEKYYTEHITEYEQPKKVHVAHILVRVPPVGGSYCDVRLTEIFSTSARPASGRSGCGSLGAVFSL